MEFRKSKEVKSILLKLEKREISFTQIKKACEALNIPIEEIKRKKITEFG